MSDSKQIEHLYSHIWQIHRYNHSGSLASTATADDYLRWSLDSFRFLEEIQDAQYSTAQIDTILPKFYKSHSDVFHQHYTLGKSRLKQHHLAGNMAFSAGIGPAFRAMLFGYKAGLDPPCLDSLVKVMLLHDVHKCFEKTDRNVQSFPERGPCLSIAVAEKEGLVVEQSEKWLILHHDAPGHQLDRDDIRDERMVRMLCLVKLADRCDKLVYPSTMEAIEAAPPKKLRRDNRLISFLESLGKIMGKPLDAIGFLATLGIDHRMLTLAPTHCHIWETPDHYLQMLSGATE